MKLKSTPVQLTTELSHIYIDEYIVKTHENIYSWFDETGDFSNDCYSLAEARIGLIDYCNWINTGRDFLSENIYDQWV